MSRVASYFRAHRLRAVKAFNRAPSTWAAAAGLAALALYLLLLVAGSAHAQSVGDFQRSYVNPFPGGDRYRVVVLGDSLGDGLWSGLYRTFQDDNNLEIVKRSKVSTGFVRTDYYDWNAALQDILKTETYQIAVVMVGANDDQPIRVGKEFLKPGTDAWREAYGQRVEAFIKKLRAAGVAVYWVGLPIMRSPDDSQDAEMMNDIFREKAFINGAKYVDTWNGFTDDAGRYSAYGPDMTGQVRRLRADDGVHFTMRGYLKLAHFVEKEIRHDLSLAKLERNIPLAGDTDEQARTVGHVVTATSAAPSPPVVEHLSAPPQAAASASAAPPQQSSSENPSAEQGTSASPAPAADANTPGQPAPSNQASGVDVIRPAISDTTLQAAQSMTPQGAAASQPENETVQSDLPGNLTAISSISSASDLSASSSKPRLPLTQRPYYKVLVKGEQPKPKTGRADDFAWPKG